jgi:hypothetical protein
MTSSVENSVREAFAEQAKWGGLLGSPLTALLCELIGRRLDRSSEIGRRIVDWQGRPGSRDDALPLRIAGGLNALVRKGAAPWLARHYPPNVLPDPDIFWADIDHTLRDCGPELSVWLDGAPQTNEVGRSALLMAGLMTIAARYRLPMALFELGASAGLNLLPDRYRYDLGGLAAGAANSAVRLTPEWEGPPPPDAPVSILRRHGVDLLPLNAADAQDRERLLAYVWPDQTARVIALNAALAIAASERPQIEWGDAADWIETRLNLAPEVGMARVVTHTIAFQYFPAETKSRIAAHLARVGAAATVDAPLAWLRYEMDPNVPTLTLTLWPDGTERILAVGHPHGRSVSWRAGRDEGD